jgi:acid phosphatase family membrane protein YuiD
MTASKELFPQITSNHALWTAILAWALAQWIKAVIELFRKRRIRLSILVSSGGMPSSHSSFVTALSTSIGLMAGFDSPVFAIAAIFSLVVMYDASGVRRAAGQQAHVINRILDNIEDHGIVLDKKLKELLGHSPAEVLAGAALGIAVAALRA